MTWLRALVAVVVVGFVAVTLPVALSILRDRKRTRSQRCPTYGKEFSEDYKG